jgi:hypothetical protein
MLGGNAVIAADVDYAEVGGGKGMLMVCMAGTAVKVLNPQEVFEGDVDRLEELQKAILDLNLLREKNLAANA